MVQTVFWSWQSDLPARETRDLIRSAITAALQSLTADFSEAERPEIDHDTRGLPGSPDIVAAILRKIDDAAVFVGDVTPIVVTENGRHVANPNVLIELGYAKRALTTDRVIQVWNTAITQARPENLPFDMRHRRAPISYELPIGATRKQLQETRDALTKQLEIAIRLALAAAPPQTPPTLQWQSTSDSSRWPNELALTVNVDSMTSTEIRLEGTAAAYARLIPERWNPKPFLLRLLDQDDRPGLLGSATGLGWGPTTGGFLVYRDSPNVEATGITTTATRFFRDTGEIWGIDSRFFTGQDAVFSHGYAFSNWDNWLRRNAAVCRSLGGEGPIHVKLGISGLQGTHWPAPIGNRAGRRAIESSAEIAFVLNGSVEEIAAIAEAEANRMIQVAATAYGIG